MIFDQILFHNVEELEETEKGYLLRRVCKKVRDGISDGVQNNRFATGVELRFRIFSGRRGIFFEKCRSRKYDDPYRISDRHGEAAAACGGVSSAL